MSLMTKRRCHSGVGLQLPRGLPGSCSLEKASCHVYREESPMRHDQTNAVLDEHGSLEAKIVECAPLQRVKFVRPRSRVLRHGQR